MIHRMKSQNEGLMYSTLSGKYNFKKNSISQYNVILIALFYLRIRKPVKFTFNTQFSV